MCIRCEITLLPLLYTAKMREIIILDDDEPGPSSQPHSGLTEEQKSRMLQQKQLAMARLEAKRLQQIQFSSRNDHNLASNSQIPSEPWKHTAPESRSGHWNERVEAPEHQPGLQLPSYVDSDYDNATSTSQFPWDSLSSECRASIERDVGLHTVNVLGERKRLGNSEELYKSPKYRKMSSDLEPDPLDGTLGNLSQRAGEVGAREFASEGMDRRTKSRPEGITQRQGAHFDRWNVHADVNGTDQTSWSPEPAIALTIDANVSSWRASEGHRHTSNVAAFESSSSLSKFESKDKGSGEQEVRDGSAVYSKSKAEIDSWSGGSAQVKVQSVSVPGEVVGEWRCVRKTSAPGSSFGRQMRNPSSEDTRDIGRWDSSKKWREMERLYTHVSYITNETGPEQPTSWTYSEIGPGEVLEKHKLSGITKEAGDAVAEVQKLAKPVPSKQQMQVLKAIAEGKSVFVTGSAGTGKSFILEDALQTLRRMYGQDAVFVTAPTGLAACALGGTTIHAFSGAGIIGDNEGTAKIVDKVMKRREPKARWKKARALIIDEISMIDGEFFDTLENIARMVRGRSLVWGGIQLIVTGDFFQLPPIKPRNLQKNFAFQADCWNQCFHVQVELTHVFRQRDSQFVSMLNEIRRGVCSPSTLQRLQNCHGPLKSASTGIEMTRLYPRIMDVSHENDQKLRALRNELVEYIAKDEAINDFARRQLNSMRAALVQPLCVGAQVMLIKNLETSVGLVNGARGVVVRFSDPDDPSTKEFERLGKHINPANRWPFVRFACDGVDRLLGPESWSVFEGEKEVAKRTQVPLILAWALSVHKCQGMTLDRVETDLAKAFDHGMVYVALSRVRSLEGLRLIGFDPTKIKCNSQVTKFYEGLRTKDVIDLEDS